MNSVEVMVVTEGETEKSFVDYGLKDWPMLSEARALSNPEPQIVADMLNSAARKSIDMEFAEWRSATRYFPFTAMHEFEALLFSGPEVLAQDLDISLKEVESVLRECGAPERINSGVETAPSKRLQKLAKGHYGKIARGIPIAMKIGIEKMRMGCPQFDKWLCAIEQAKG